MKYEVYFNEVEKMIEENIREALTNTGNLIKAEAKLLTPVKTGQLRRSLSYRTDAKNASVTIGTNIDYAEAVHNGTSRQRSQPFLKDAIYQNINEIENIFKESLGKVGE